MGFYGDVFTINNVSSEPGDEIAVFDSQGTFCGHYVVTNAGFFYLVVYGDESNSPEDEGASINEDLTFKVWDASEAIEITLTNSMFIQKDVFGQPQIDTIPPKYLGDKETRGMGIAATTNSYGDHFNCNLLISPNAMYLYVDVFTINNVSSEIGDEIAVYDQQGTCCEHYVVTNAGTFMLAVLGDSTFTPADEGASLNEELTFIVWDASEAIEITLTNSMFIQKDVWGQPQIDTIPPKFLGDYETRGMGIAATTNTAPNIIQIENQQTVIDFPISIPFQLTDTEGGDMRISAASSLTALVMPENIRFTGTNITSDGQNYTIHASASMPENITMMVQPVSGQSGTSTITLNIDDSGKMSQVAFEFSVLSQFTEDENISLSGVSNGSVVFGDYDNDGDLDILLTGTSPFSLFPL